MSLWVALPFVAWQLMILNSVHVVGGRSNQESGAEITGFLILGDWGGLPYSPYTTPMEIANAKRMGSVATSIGAGFVVALGDNFYYDGVRDVDDARFFETFEHVFSSASLHLPWFVIAGNHDHYGNVSAQLLYTNKSGVWNFPNYYYSRSWSLPGGNQTMKLVLIDTVLLCGNSGMDADLLQPAGPDNLEAAEEQWQWIESELAASRDDYLFVGGHFPVWSIAEHGPTHCLVNRLKPLLEKYDVTAYICGHDHSLQHIHELGSDVHYFVVGAANFVDTSTSHSDAVPAGSLMFHWADESSWGGFAAVTVYVSYIKLTFIDSQGDDLHSQTMMPRKFRGF